MALRDELVGYLDKLLKVDEVSDPYCPNGLQVEGGDLVHKVGLAVDACLQSFEALADCQLIITHHGLFWPAIKKITGPTRASIGFLIERNISLYSAHLPLDVHDTYGNNVVLLDKLGWKSGERFDQVGWIGEGRDVSSRELQEELSALLGSAVRLLAFGSERIKRLAISSGGGSIGILSSAKAAGADLLITGEASHPIYHACKEMGMNLILAGHYQTETWGLRALAPLLETQFDLHTRFVSFPTGF